MISAAARRAARRALLCGGSRVEGRGQVLRQDTAKAGFAVEQWVEAGAVRLWSDSDDQVRECVRAAIDVGRTLIDPKQPATPEP